MYVLSLDTKDLDLISAIQWAMRRWHSCEFGKAEDGVSFQLRKSDFVVWRR
jgi:hypothetical protein